MARLKLIKDFDKLEETFRAEIEGVFSKGDSVAVKLHMGEIKNPYYLSPEIVKNVVNVLKEYDVRPFLIDTTVLYKSERDTVEKYLKTAKLHGFTEEKIGCPIVISDTGVDVEAKDITVEVSKEMAEADSMLVLSHVKGHCCYGFGGAIKNLGMGGVTRKSKADVHKAKEASTDELLSEAAGAVLDAVGKKVFYVNFLMNIAKECDCCNKPGPIVAEDIGVLFGKDIVAIDKASLDLINEQKKDVFMKLHNHNPELHVDFAEKLGIGSREYSLD
ncbi:DUF362 domain-containing protein [Candidatus Woesearchaeota archaeon]|nr:DUF362 domain-containing protein [Candidatus Woesearchaeota archaeon]